ncbi:MAG: helix-turn-helix transcriptional regulator [Hoeflea sp.]|nr:helix-turn-helix transcriptional regulator [Hoeflea sp.]
MTRPLERLTHAERTCLHLAANGQAPEAIAEQFDGDPDTVDTHLASARRKLMANTTIEAAARALKLGLIE